MAHTVPALPNRFPCWCRATYSWGGESKRDLGFVEGDLIECLNAGDGSWWMGRLRRDKRAMGLFPSNFVQVLDEGFRPVSQSSSPAGKGSLSTPKASPQKTKTFRKPFQAYARAGSPNPAAVAAGLEASSRGSSPNLSRQTSFVQQSSTSPSRQSSILQTSSSPIRQPRYLQTSSSPSRRPSYLQTSITPTRQPSYLQQPDILSPSGCNSATGSRSASPTPSAHFGPYNPPSSNTYEDVGSPPPPPPPPHRVAYNAPPAGSTPSPTPSMNNRYSTYSRAQSPAPPSPAMPGHTPSPLRDAMDDVMSSLHDMELRQDEQYQSPEQERMPLDPWSPEAFEELQTNSHARADRRPRSSLGIASFHRDYHQDEVDNEVFPQPQYRDGLPQDGHQNGRTERSIRPMGAGSPRPPDELFLPDEHMGPPPAPPPKNSPYQPRPQSSMGAIGSVSGSTTSSWRLRNRKSAYELGRGMLDRTFTTKSSATSSSTGVRSDATNGTTSTERTSQSIMSGHSAGGFSATSAGSLARRKWGSIHRSRPGSVIDTRQDAMLGLNGGGATSRPHTPSHYSSNQSRPGSRAAVDTSEGAIDCGGLGGLTTLKTKKSGFFKKLVESAKTGAASARSSIAAGQIETPRAPIKNLLPNGVTAIAGGNAARDMGLGGSKSDTDWVQVRRDVNRSNSLSRNERTERIERCQMMDYPVIAPMDALVQSVEGDEGLDGLPIYQPLDFHTVNLQLVDKSARFVNSLPPMTNPTSLAQGYVCRPYRSDVQKLRAIFTWVSEKVSWEEDFEGEVDSRRVIQMRRGCSEEVAVLVSEMCSAVGLHAEIVRGYLKTPGEIVECDSNPRPNHWWNAVIVDDCWRIMDCSLASPTNPKRAQYSSSGPQIAESGFFLARPTEMCYTHIPSLFEQQHICPPIETDVLLALPCACPPYFKNQIQLVNYDTSLLRIENLELVHIQFTVPSDVECVAEVEARSYARDIDGDVFESGDTTTTRALAQAEWINGQKRYTVKAYLSGDEGHGVLKIFAGKRGLMHSIKDNPHPLAFALPIVHTGKNPPYEFLRRHPTPHAQRHDLYVAQPQCARLAINNTFVFAVRQHPSSLNTSVSPAPRSTSPLPFTRPSSAMSMISSSAVSNADYFSQTSSNSSGNAQQPQKPAKLAIQAPSGKILRLMRKSDNSISSADAADGGVWETIIKIGERGTWRGLVLADRSARWCVFGEWDCV